MATASLSSRRLLPPGAGRILGRRSAELLGLLFAFLGLGVLLGLASHSPADPSFNTATAEPARNLAGPAGAHLADLLVQGFGAAGALPGLALLAWAWRLLTHRGFARPVLRPLALLLALPLVAGLLELVPLSQGQGGVVGQAVAAGIVGSAERAFGPLGLAAVGAALSLGAVLCTLGALGLSASDWRSAGRAAQVATSGTLGRARASSGWLARAFGRIVPRRAAAPPAPARPAPRFEPALAPRQARVDEDDDDQEDAPLPAPPSEKPRRTRVEVPAPAPARNRPPPPRQAALDLGGYVPPPLELLATPPRRRERTGPDEAALEANARLLEGVLSDFGVRGAIVNIRPGPVVTMYELEPAPGTKSARVIGLADDIARSMSAISVRVATVPGRNVLGIELPNAVRETVYLSEMLGEESFGRDRARLNLALGKDIGGAPIVVDLARMPHLLIAGTTGSGKSVAINTMILSLLYRLTPEECRFVMIDPKMLELSVYEGIPHLLSPVVTEPAKAVAALKWTVREMERRYRAMSQIGVRNIAGFNARVVEARANGEVLSRRVQTGFDPETNQPVFEDQPLALEPLPFIVVVVDEMADLMIVAGKEIEAAVQRLAQMARAAGIHIIMATQRPSVDVITGTIKANFPTRVSFQVTSRIDSRTILGEQGAEQLLGQGDMLYMAGGGRISRVHGPFVSDREVEAIVSHLRAQGTPDYVEEVTESADDDDAAPALFGDEGGEGSNALYDQAVALVVREGKASTSFLQRHLQLGYNRAAKLIEAMEKDGVVGPANHVGKREVLARRPREDER